MLIELGYSPEGVESSQAAVDLLHSDHSLEALITDCGLPGLTGGELAQLARERWPELPICFVTGYDSNDAEIGALRPNEILLDEAAWHRRAGAAGLRASWGDKSEILAGAQV